MKKHLDLARVADGSCVILGNDPNPVRLSKNGLGFICEEGDYRMSSEVREKGVMPKNSNFVKTTRRRF